MDGDDHPTDVEEAAGTDAGGSGGGRGRRGTGAPGGRWRSVALVLGAGAVVAWSWWVVGLPTFSGGAAAAVVGSGMVAGLVGIGLRRPPGPEPVPPGRRLWAWAAVVGVGGGWQLAAYLQHPREDHPTFSSLTNALLDSQPARTVAFVVWLLVAVELVRR